MIRGNLWLKIAAVVLAVALWMFVMARTYTSITISAPIEFRNVPAGLELVHDESVTFVSLGLRGPVRIVKNMRPGDVHVTVDLSGVRNGQSRLELTDRDVKLPALIRLININPSSIKVMLRLKKAG